MAKEGNSIKRKYHQWFKTRLGMFDYRNGWMKGDCPDCGKEKKFGVNLATNRSNCFTCGYSEKPIRVIMHVEGLETYAQVLTLVNAFEGWDYVVDKNVQRMSFKTDSILPEGYKLLRMGKSVMGRSARNYMKKRGFDIDELSMAGFGYCTKGDYFGYIIMPFYIGGKLVYFNARNYMANGPKYDNPTIEDFSVGKSVLIYNQDAFYMYDKVYIVESVLNARTLGDDASGFGGKALSEWQISYIIKSPCKRVVILLDPDAYREAIKLALRLVDHKKVKVVLLPGDSDVNDLGKKKTLSYVRKNRYLTQNQLFKLNNEL